ISFQGNSVDIDVLGTVQRIVIDTVVHINKITHKAELKSFKVDRMDDLKGKIEGLGPLNFVFNAVSRAYTHTLEASVRTTVETSVKKLIKDIVSTIEY